MSQCPPLRLLPFDDPETRRTRAGKPLAIVGTGPSYDLLPAGALDGVPVMALNAAITEFVGRADVVWACHDLHSIWRGPFSRRVKAYAPWMILTRRCYVPGPFGEIEWKGIEKDPRTREKREVRMRDSFPWRMTMAPAGSTVWWYCEWPDLPAHMRSVTSVVEIALDVAACWGAEPIVLVGFDAGPVRVAGRDAGYGSKWAWKPCQITAPKFRSIREAIVKNRGRWPVRTYTVSPYWPESPFTSVRPEDARKLLTTA